MAEKNKETEKPATEKPTAEKATKGRLVVVLANGEHAEAKLVKDRGNGRVDLEIAATGQLITSSPNDPTGKQPDSHHFAE